MGTTKRVWIRWGKAPTPAPAPRKVSRGDRRADATRRAVARTKPAATTTPGHDDPGAALATAVRWLAAHLAERAAPVDVADVLDAARVDGHTEANTRRAARVVCVERRGSNGGTTWALPTDEARAEQQHADHGGGASARQGGRRSTETTSARGVRVPTGQADAFGQYRESVAVSGPQEASQWDARGWHQA